MEDNTNVNAAILERLEKVVQSLQENSVKMGQLLAVHDEKLDKQDRIDAVLFEKIEQVDAKLDRHATDIKKGCERDILLVDKTSKDDREEDVDNCWCIDSDQFHCVTNWPKIFKRCIDTTTTIE